MDKTTDKKCRKEYYKKYNEENKECRKEYYKKYNKENKDKLNKYKKEYYEKNKEYREKNIIKSKEYYENNKEKLKEKAKIKVECDNCKSIVRCDGLWQHKKTKKCMNNGVTPPRGDYRPLK